ncbi:hypothetical protein N8993_08670 [Pseudomonadales bacterium]|nr:hypothetical protein [Pseudomonadales bacterium]
MPAQELETVVNFASYLLATFTAQLQYAALKKNADHHETPAYES